MTLVWCLVITLWTTTLANSQELPPEVGILKQINRVNDDGSYTFGYEATDGSFKIETRDVLGNIKGMFGFIDENGELKRVSYTANNGTGFQASGNIGNSPSDKVIPTSGYTTVRPASTDSSSRRPVLILRTPPDDNTRAPVIQHIPRKPLVKGSTTAQSTTTPVYGEYINGRRPQPITDLFLNPNNEATTTSEPQVTETPDDITTTNHPIRKILITKRPVDEKVTKSKGGNALRRQLTRDPESRSDTADVYSGDTTPRYLPPGRSQFVPSLPPQLVTAYRNQLLTQNGLRESTTQPPYRPDFNFPPPGYLPFDQNQYPPTPPPIPNRNRIPIPLPNLPQPYPIPGTISPRNRPSVVDEQEYPVQDNRKYIPSTTRPINNSVRPVYQQDDGVSPPYQASYRSLRDELMEYLLQYLQYRSNRINPYLPPNYQNQFPNPNVNYPYPNQPYNFNPYINPNFANPYINPNINPNAPFQNPYINPYTPQPLGYPNVNYPQNIPNVPYVTPNIQYSGQQYTQSSQYVPRGYEPDPRLPPVESQRSRPPQASTDAISYQLPPAQLLRMLLARGTTKEYDTQPTQTTTLESYTTTPQPTTKQPVRNVQIVAAASTTSSVTVQPPKDEMEMEA